MLCNNNNHNYNNNDNNNNSNSNNNNNKQFFDKNANNQRFQRKWMIGYQL